LSEQTSLDKLVPDPFGLRVSYEDKTIVNLAGSILQNGIITPLLVRPKGEGYEILDGNYRYKALEHIKWEKPVPINSKEMTDEEALLEAVISNWHRRNFSFIDKSNSVEKLEQQGFSEEKICTRLEIKKDMLNKYLSYKRNIPKEVEGIIVTRYKKITARHAGALVKLRKHPDKQRQLAERIVTEKLDGAVAEREADKALKPPKPEPEFKPEVFTVWHFSKCDERFGVPDFPGRIPGQIFQNILYYYTREGDLVVDPMAGSGTTFDVCKLMNRKCLCYDIKSMRQEIKEHDIRHGFPKEAKLCDLILLDPPYFKKLQGKQRYNELGEATPETYLNFIEKLAKDCFETIRKGGIITLLISDYIYGEFSLLTSEYYLKFKDAGFKAVNRIQVPLTTQQYSGHDVERAKKNREMLNITRDLYIFRK